MEGMALDPETGHIHGFLQSPLSDGDAFNSGAGKNERIERYAGFTRWIGFDPELGDMVALGHGKFIVIEQGAAPGHKVTNKLMLVEIGDATDIGAAACDPDSSSLEQSSMAGRAVGGADWSAVVPLKKSLLLDLNTIGWHAEKAEGLTIVNSTTTLACARGCSMRPGRR